MPEKFPALAAYRKSRWYKRSLWVGAFFLIYLLFGFFALPAIIKSQLLKRLPPITKRQVAIRQVQFNPLALSLTIRGFSLTEPDGQVFASWEELYVNFQLSSIFRLGWTFDEVSLKQPYGHLIWFKDGQFNFANMGGGSAPPPKPAKSAKPGGLPAINVARLHIDDGLVVWEDQTHSLPLKVELKPINFSLTNLTTRIGQGSFYGFEAKSDSGKRLAWAGELVAQPFQSRGRLELEGIQGARWTAYLRDHLRAVVTDGRVNVVADYSIGTGTNGFSLIVSNGGVQLTGFQVQDPTNNEVITTLPLLDIQSIDFNLQNHNLRAGLIKLDGYTKPIRIEKDGTLNLNLVVEQKTVAATATNIAAAAAPPPSTPTLPWVFAVDDFQLTNCTVSFSDLSRSNRFESTISPMQVRVRHFTTQPESDATYEFNLPTESGEAVSGNGTLCVIPLRLGGTVKVSDVEIKKYAPYYEAFLRGEVLGGKINAGLDFRLLSTAQRTDLTVTNAGVALSDFQLKAADGGETVVAIQKFQAGQTEFDLRNQSVTVGVVESSGGSILLRRSKEGALNLAGLFNGPAAGTNAGTNIESVGATNVTSDAKAEKSTWNFMVKDVSFESYSINFKDQTPAKDVDLKIDQVAFAVADISTRSNAPIKLVSLEARLNESGKLQIDGGAKLSPPSAEFDLKVSDLDLRPFQPYLNDAVRIGISSGQFSTRSHLRYGGLETGPKLKFSGDLSVTNLVTTDQVLLKEFVRWDLLSVNGLDLAIDPNQLQIKEINWRGFNTSVIIGPDHRPNLQTILPPKLTNAPTTQVQTVAAASPPSGKASDFPIQVDAFTLENAAFLFADESIEPHCAFDIGEFGGSIKGLSSDENATATVDVRGKVDAASPFSISGKVNPLARNLSLDLTVGFTNTDLTAFSTYLEKYAGHPLNKGKLLMGLHYEIHQKQLKAENSFMLDHFTLGARNDSTNATHLPVKLAVALLKDTAGRINLDLPLTGRTDDPQFRIAPILLKALLNLMLKAATSPFSLLGSLVGGGGEELSFVEFGAGRADISDAESQKLDKLVKALEQRPALNVEIAGSFDSQNDGTALARLKLEQELKTLRLKELARVGATVSSTASVSLDPAQRERLLKVVLAEMGTNKTLILQPIVARDTNGVDTATNAIASRLPSPPELAAKIPPTRRWQDGSAAQAKGASLLVPGIEMTGLGVVKPVAAPELPPGTNGVSAVDDIEATLISAIQMSEDEKRALMKQRATAVQTAILKDGKISADRVYIVTPKTASQAGKGETRANLSLD